MARKHHDKSAKNPALGAPLLALMAVAACSGGREDGGLGPDPTGAGETEWGSGGATGSGDAESWGGDGDGDDRLDLGSGGENDTANDGCQGFNCPTGCNAVDVLFVIDNSSSMGDHQAALATSAPGFADALFASLPPTTDLHVGVTTTSFMEGAPTSIGSTGSCEPNYGGQCSGGRDCLYDYYFTPDVAPFDENGAQGRLFEHEGQRFFAVETDQDPQPMKDWLVGALTSVGEDGSVWEMVAAGASYAFHPANAGFNEGFLRDEGAVLVLFVLTDEVGNSPESVDAYHDLVVQAKEGCGGAQCVVTGGIMKPCLETAADTRIVPFLSSFGRQPAIGDIEADPETFPDFLGATLANVIAETCEKIPPVG